MNTLTISNSDFFQTQLTPKEAQAAREAWEEYSLCNEIALNKNNPSYDYYKQGVVDFLSTAMAGEIMFQSSLYNDFSLDNEEDYDSVVKGVAKEIGRKFA